MKKIITIISIIVFAAGIYMVHSCSKDEAANAVNQQENNECTTCKDGKLIAEKINNFKKRLEKAKLNPKDGEVIELEAARQNMELLFNASYGFPAEEYAKIQIDTVEFDIPVDANGNILMSDVVTKYDQMHDLVKDVYDNINFTDKHLVSLFLVFEDDNKGTVTAKAISTIGEEGSDNMGHFNHCWWYGDDLGMCNGNYFGEKDGGDTLANELFANRPIPINCPQGYHGVIVPDYENTFSGKNGTLGSGYIFFLQKPSDTPFIDTELKLEASEMNSWYDKEYTFLFTVLPESLNKPVNWIMTSINIDAFEHFSQNPNIHWINHPNNVEYGLFYCVSNNEVNPAVDL